MSVYSKQLAAQQPIHTGVNTVYTVPTQRVTIWKSAVVLNLNAAAQRVVVDIRHSGGTIAFADLYLAAFGSNGDTAVWQPYMVLNAGDSIVLSPQTGDISAILSGSELVA